MMANHAGMDFLLATKEDVGRVLQDKAPDVTAAKPMSFILEKPDGVWSNETIPSRWLLGRLMLVRKLSTPVRYELPWHCPGSGQSMASG